MSDTTRPKNATADERPAKVVIISHSPLFYWWPVWAIGFVMAAVSYMSGVQMAFVPLGTVAGEATVDGRTRDVLIAPEGSSLPAATDAELLQPRLRMAKSNDPGVVWAMTLILVIVVTHVKMRGVWSLVVIIFLGFTTVLLAVLGLWDPIL